MGARGQRERERERERGGKAMLEIEAIGVETAKLLVEYKTTTIPIYRCPSLKVPSGRPMLAF